MVEVLASLIPGFDKIDKFLKVVEIVIITHDAFPVVDNAGFFISFQPIQQCFCPVAPGIFRKSQCFDLAGKQSFSAGCILAVPAAVNPFGDTAFPVFAPFSILAPGQVQKPVLFAALHFTFSEHRQQASPHLAIPNSRFIYFSLPSWFLQHVCFRQVMHHE